MVTHIEDHSNGWRESIKHFTGSSACERPAVVECFVCRWIGLEGKRGQIEDIVISGFECRDDPNSIEKK